MKPIETAGELYREMKKRGLHLREENGRDNALLQELISKLDCPDNRLQRFLDKSSLSAEEFLLIYLQITAPFARMFQEIWAFLSKHKAPKANETLSLRFGFDGAEKACSIDLEQFRRYVETTRTVLTPAITQIWPYEALNGLFDVGRKLIGPGDEQIWKPYSAHGRYRPGEKYILPTVTVQRHPFDKIVQTIRDVFQRIIDGYAIEKENRDSARQLPELVESEDRSTSLERPAFLLTDLLPTWFFFFSKCSEICDQPKDAAFEEYQDKVKPHLLTGTEHVETRLLEALDVLDLPFWRHRWHTYEVWATVLTLRSLEGYRPSLRVNDGHIPLDGYSAEVIADLKVTNYASACVAAQVETVFSQGKRKAIKPDLRVCFADPSIRDNTAGVVEFKQRATNQSKHIAEIATAYAVGCRRSGGVLIVNYDITNMSVTLPPRSYYLDGVQPLNPDKIAAFDKQLISILQDAAFIPIEEKTIVLLDVSSSMGDSYFDKQVQIYLRSLIEMRWLKILRFNDGLVKGGDFDPDSAPSLKTSGGTQLGQALREIESYFGLPHKILIVTDGGHDNPDDLLNRIPNVSQCMPKDIGLHIKWLS